MGIDFLSAASGCSTVYPNILAAALLFTLFFKPPTNSLAGLKKF
jgi:hypothetical protein